MRVAIPCICTFASSRMFLSLLQKNCTFALVEAIMPPIKTLIERLLDKARASDPIHVALPEAQEGEAQAIGLAPKRQAQGTSTSSSSQASEGVPRFADLRQQLKAQDLEAQGKSIAEVREANLQKRRPIGGMALCAHEASKKARPSEPRLKLILKPKAEQLFDV